MENWLEENDADRGHLILSIGKIADIVTEEARPESSSSESEEEEVVPRPTMAHVRESIDTLPQYINGIKNKQIKGYYYHLRTLRELIIRDQYTNLMQIRLDKFIKPASQPDSPPPSSRPPSPTPQRHYLRSPALQLPSLTTL